MKKHIYIASLLALGVSLNACDDLIEPAPENTQSFENFLGAPASAHGALLTSYVKLSFPALPESDLATDDAVARALDNNWRRIATGAWSSDNNPLSNWNNNYFGIQNLNYFINQCDKVRWYENDLEDWQDAQVDHFLGEAYGLRALFHYQLLQAQGGKVNGKLMGVLYHDQYETGATDFNQARLSYAETYERIMNDFNESILRLPDQYKDGWKEAEIPQRFKDMVTVQRVKAMNRINGQLAMGKIDGRIAKSYRALCALMAASPAYGVETWENAAKYAQEVVNDMGGVNGITDMDIDWFTNVDEIKNIKTDQVPAMSIWFMGKDENNSWEKDNFPSSLYGTGNVNPTQNLVDAFPMANGYPISESASGYNENKPYEGRDPRLALYVLYNGGDMGGKKITTAEYADNNDGIDKDPSVSTRTGYYLKKFLAPSANPSSTNGKKEFHITNRLRSLEIYLAYAEAANEAWGPTSGSPSAYDVIKKIRSVAGITGGDAYLESVKGDQAKMRDLIRNERRICLCFENKRFWDLRRWNVALNEPAKGMRISGTASNPQYEIFEVEARKYKDYQIYGPLPTADVNRFSNLDQNTGW